MKPLKMFSRYPLSCLCAAAIWVACLVPVPETPLKDVPLIDKWTHFVMYGGLCAVTWMEYGRSCRAFDKWKALLWIAGSAAVMGGAIEVAQATCTGGTRSGDWADWGADVVGVALGQLTGMPLARVLARRRKG